MIKITNYTKSEIVEIQYGEDATTYVYDLKSEKLSKQLLSFLKLNVKVKVEEKEYK